MIAVERAKLQGVIACSHSKSYESVGQTVHVAGIAVRPFAVTDRECCSRRRLERKRIHSPGTRRAKRTRREDRDHQPRCTPEQRRRARTKNMKPHNDGPTAASNKGGACRVHSRAIEYDAVIPNWNDSKRAKKGRHLVVDLLVGVNLQDRRSPAHRTSRHPSTGRARWRPAHHRLCSPVDVVVTGKQPLSSYWRPSTRNTQVGKDVRRKVPGRYPDAVREHRREPAAHPVCYPGLPQAAVACLAPACTTARTSRHPISVSAQLRPGAGSAPSVLQRLPEHAQLQDGRE
eukprot:scaffold1885_cov402-Prasinococcus_capsulatus_cf.AAC.3